MKGYYLELGICQQTLIELLNNIFPRIEYSNGTLWSFHESDYKKILQDGTVTKRL